MRAPVSGDFLPPNAAKKNGSRLAKTLLPLHLTFTMHEYIVGLCHSAGIGWANVRMVWAVEDRLVMNSLLLFGGS